MIDLDKRIEEIQFGCGSCGQLNKPDSTGQEAIKSLITEILDEVSMEKLPIPQDYRDSLPSYNYAVDELAGKIAKIKESL